MSDIMYFSLTLFPQQSEVIPPHRINRLVSVVETGCLLRGTNYIYWYHLGWFMCVLIILCQRVPKGTHAFRHKPHPVYPYPLCVTREIHSFLYSRIYGVPALSTAAPPPPQRKAELAERHTDRSTSPSLPKQQLLYLHDRCFVFGIQTTGVH